MALERAAGCRGVVRTGTGLRRHTASTRPHRGRTWDRRCLGRDGFLAGHQATQQDAAGVGGDARQEGARISRQVRCIHALGDVQRRLRVATLAPGQTLAKCIGISRACGPVHAARDGTGGVQGATDLLRRERQARRLDPIAQRSGGNSTRIRARARRGVVRGEDPAVHRRYVHVVR